MQKLLCSVCILFIWDCIRLLTLVGIALLCGGKEETFAADYRVFLTAASTTAVTFLSLLASNVPDHEGGEDRNTGEEKHEDAQTGEETEA